MFFPIRVVRVIRMLKKYPITNTEYPISKGEKAQVLARDKPRRPVRRLVHRRRIRECGSLGEAGCQLPLSIQPLQTGEKMVL
jgi:hypothetical protein